MINENNPLIFTHIPKTGGMSLFATMSEHYGMDIADMYDVSAYDSNKNEQLAELLTDPLKSVYTGHFPFGIHEFLSRPCCYMAIVRKPLDRIMSLYFYSLQFREVVLRTVRQSEHTLGDLFEKRMVADFYAEFTPWINGDSGLATFLRCPSAELNNGMVRRFSGVGMTQSTLTRDDLEMAKNNIEQYYSLVGVQERYQDTLSVVRNTFQIDVTEFRVNTRPEDAKKNAGPNVALRKRIKEMNKLDIELYDWIYNRFENQHSHPTPPIVVDASGRSDFENVKLWRAIGSSPMRQSAMANSRLGRRG